jgi:ribosomal protein S6
MILYETLILTVPEITNDESKQLEKQIDTVLQKHKGVKVSFDRWGKYKLAQPVNKNNYGVYFLARFEANQENLDILLADLSEYLTLKAANIVMRFMNTVLDPKKGLNYLKPSPLDESARDIDKFLKDNKMDGLIGTANKSSAPVAVNHATTEPEDDACCDHEEA